MRGILAVGVPWYDHCRIQIWETHLVSTAGSAACSRRESRAPSNVAGKNTTAIPVGGGGDEEGNADRTGLFVLVGLRKRRESRKLEAKATVEILNDTAVFQQDFQPVPKHSTHKSRALFGLPLVVTSMKFLLQSFPLTRRRYQPKYDTIRTVQYHERASCASTNEDRGDSCRRDGHDKLLIAKTK